MVEKVGKNFCQKVAVYSVGFRSAIVFKGRTQFVKITLYTMMAIAILIGAYGGSAEGKSRAEAMEIVGQEFQKDWIHVVYPQVKGLAEKEVENKINAVLKSHADQFICQMRQVADEAKADPRYNLYEAKMSYEVKWESDEILSLLYDTVTYTGGAHGSHSEIGYTFNLKNGKKISLEELVGKAAVAKYDNMILAEIRSKAIPIFEPYKGIGSETTYYLLDDKRLMVVFQQYEIGPYSSGILRFQLPYGRKGDY